MLRESSFFIRTKIAADLILLAAINFVSLSIFDEFESILSSAPSLLLVITISLLVWLACARSFGLYSDLRMKPVSIEWVMFVKAFSIYTLLTSFIFFQVFKIYPFDRQQFLI